MNELERYLKEQIDKVKLFDVTDKEEVIKILKETHQNILDLNPSNFRSKFQRKLFLNDKLVSLEILNYEIQCLKSNFVSATNRRYFQCRLTLASILVGPIIRNHN